MLLIRARQRNIHLVVSKWDLLVRGDGGRYTMADVRSTLAAMSPAFSNFQRNPRLGKLRMIPVAALGMNGFAVPAGAGGGMMRNPGVEWSPWNVEVPFFCAVPDIIRYDVDRMAAAAGTPGQANLARSIARITLAVLAISGLRATAGVPGFNLNFPISEAVQRIRQYLGDRYARSSVPAFLDEGTAIGYVVNECYGSVDEFERRWPDSRLSRRGAWRASLMDDKAWPFLIGRTRTEDHRIVVIPDFMAAGALVSALRFSADSGAPGSSESVQIREIQTPVKHRVTVIYRVNMAHADYWGLPGERVLTDEQGRPIVLTEGLVTDVRRRGAAERDHRGEP